MYFYYCPVLTCVSTIPTLSVHIWLNPKSINFIHLFHLYMSLLVLKITANTANHEQHRIFH